MIKSLEGYGLCAVLFIAMIVSEIVPVHAKISKSIRSALESYIVNLVAAGSMNEAHAKFCPNSASRLALDKGIARFWNQPLAIIDSTVVDVLGCSASDTAPFRDEGEQEKSDASKKNQFSLLRNDSSLPECNGNRNMTHEGPRGIRVPAEVMLRDADNAAREGNYKTAYQILIDIDRNGEAAINDLPLSTPWIDLVFQRQVSAISLARGKLASLYRTNNPAPFTHDDKVAAAWYDKAFNTKIIFDSGRCQRSSMPAPYNTYVIDYAIMYIYGMGVTKNIEVARDLLVKVFGENHSPLVFLIDHNALPQTYEEFQHTDFRPIIDRINGR